MAKSNDLENGILKLIFQNVALSNIGDASGLQPSSATGNFYITLYVDDPTDEDTGTEANYTGYSRESVVRSSSGWSVSDNVITNNAVITFGANTGTVQTITHVGIRTASSGGDLVYHGALASPLTVENGNIPKFEIGDLAISEF